MTNPELDQRIADALGRTLDDVQSMSYITARYLLWAAGEREVAAEVTAACAACRAIDAREARARSNPPATYTPPPQRFTYYTDGRHEYRVERGDDGSGTAVHGPGRHGRVQIFAGELDTRLWTLATRPVAPAGLAVEGRWGVDDGRYRVAGNPATQPARNPWESVGSVTLPNAAGLTQAELRLLGRDLLTQCANADTDAAWAARRVVEHAPPAIAVKLEPQRNP